MPRIDIWPVVHSERSALAGDLAPLTETQWATPSLCDDWTVRDTLAHMTATAKVTPASFFPKLIGSGFSFTRMQAKDIAAESGASGAETLSRFEGVITSKKRPPGPKNTMLGETIIHSEDIRLALDLQQDYPTDAVVQVVDFYKGSNLIIGAKRRIAGLTLRATDTNWSHGSGAEVSGPIVAILMAMTGRKTTIDRLSGDGVPILQERP